MWFRTGKWLQFLLRDDFIVGIRNRKGNWGLGVTIRELKWMKNKDWNKNLKLTKLSVGSIIVIGQAVERQLTKDKRDSP